MTRYRVTSTSGETGFYRSRSGGSNIVRTAERSADKVWDETLVGDGHPFDVKKFKSSGGIIDSYDEQDGFVFAKDYVTGWYANSIAGCSEFPSAIPGMLTNGEIATKVLASTNPSKAHVDLPTYVAELKDIPQLLQREGRLIRRLATTNLKYQFGIAPLVKDIVGMLDFSDQVQKRTQELAKMYTSGIRRKRNVSSGHLSQGPWVLTENSEYVGMVTQNFSVKQWAYVKWYPTTKGVPTLSEMRAQARRAVMGLTVDLSTLWELMPWSWFIDYFGNVGEYLQATRNIVGHRHGPVQVMTYRKLETSKTAADYLVNNRRRFRCSAASSSVEWKSRRKVSNATLSASLPFLSGKQLSILGSIGVTRRSRLTNGFRDPRLPNWV